MKRREKTVAADPVYNDHYVPHDLVIEILSKLPLKLQIRFGAVCRLWLNSIRKLWLNSIRKLWLNSIHDHFLQYSSGNTTSGDEMLTVLSRWKIQLVGYSNETYCLYKLIGCHPGPRVALHYLNRGTIPVQAIRFTEGITKGMGFGFDPVIQEHKVVRIFDDCCKKCTVYSLETDIWRQVTFETTIGRQVILLGNNDSSSLRNFESAIPYWNEEALCWRTENPRGMILFHLHDEKIQIIQED